VNSLLKKELKVSDDKKDPLLLDHDYDGIQELDNPLPNWWLAIFWGAIIFGVPYAIYYIALSGPSLRDTHMAQMEKINEVRAEVAAQNVQFNQEKYDSIASNPESLKAGAVVYEDNCMACHAEKGKGDVGPNLTDNYWIHSDGTAANVYPVVFNGVEDNGMPAWGEMITQDEIYQVVAYIKSLKGTKHDSPKSPQGKLIE